MKPLNRFCVWDSDTKETVLEKVRGLLLEFGIEMDVVDASVEAGENVTTYELSNAEELDLPPDFDMEI